MRNISKEEFFKKIAINSGVTDLETVRNIFYGMVKTISRELKSRHSVKLPDWGTFYLRIQDSKSVPDINKGAKIKMIIPPKTLVKFFPDWKVKEYFYNLGNEGL